MNYQVTREDINQQQGELNKTTTFERMAKRYTLKTNKARINNDKNNLEKVRLGNIEVVKG